MYEKVPDLPSNVPQKEAMLVWKLVWTPSSRARFCCSTDVPLSDPVNVFTTYRRRMTRLPDVCADMSGRAVAEITPVACIVGLPSDANSCVDADTLTNSIAMVAATTNASRI